jgi:hypothetical protein
MKKSNFLNSAYFVTIALVLFLMAGCQSSSSSTVESKYTLRATVLNDKGLIPINSTLIIEFSEEIDKGTVTDKSVYLTEDNKSISVVMEMVDATHLAIRPEVYLSPEASHVLTITTELMSVTGLHFLEPYEWHFVTAAKQDNDAPKLVAVLPISSGVKDIHTTVALQFDEPLVPEGIDHITLTDSAGQTVAGKAIETGSTLRFVPDAPLIMEQTYTITLKSTVMDYSKNQYAGVKSWSFIPNHDTMFEGGIDTIQQRLDLGAAINNIVTKGNKLYVCASNKLFIVEASSSGSFKLLSTTDISGEVYDIAIGSDVSALGTSNGIVVIDSKSMKILSTITTPSPVYGVAYNANSFYAAVSGDGIYVFDSVSAALGQDDVKVIAIDGTAFDLLCDGQNLFVAKYLGGVSRYTLSGQLVEDYPLTGAVRSLELHDNRLYASMGVQGVRGIDLTTKAVQKYDVLAYAFASGVSTLNNSNHLYVADKERGVSVLNVVTGEPVAHIRDIGDATLRGVTALDDNVYALSLVEGILVTGNKSGVLVSYSLVSTLMAQYQAPPLPDTTPPYIFSSVPMDGDMNSTGYYYGDINITFSEAMDTTSINNTTVKFNNFVESGGSCVPFDLGFSLTYNEQTKVLSVTPATAPNYYTYTACASQPGKYEVHINGVRDMAGNVMSPQIITFSVGPT